MDSTQSVMADSKDKDYRGGRHFREHHYYHRVSGHHHDNDRRGSLEEEELEQRHRSHEEEPQRRSHDSQGQHRGSYDSQGQRRSKHDFKFRRGRHEEDQRRGSHDNKGHNSKDQRRGSHDAHDKRRGSHDSHDKRRASPEEQGQREGSPDKVHGRRTDGQQRRGSHDSKGGPRDNSHDEPMHSGHSGRHSYPDNQNQHKTRDGDDHRDRNAPQAAKLPPVNLHLPIPPPLTNMPVTPHPQLVPIEPVETNHLGLGHHHERWYFFWPGGGADPTNNIQGPLPALVNPVTGGCSPLPPLAIMPGGTTTPEQIHEKEQALVEMDSVVTQTTSPLHKSNTYKVDIQNDKDLEDFYRKDLQQPPPQNLGDREDDIFNENPEKASSMYNTTEGSGSQVAVPREPRKPILPHERSSLYNNNQMPATHELQTLEKSLSRKGYYKLKKSKVLLQCQTCGVGIYKRQVTTAGYISAVLLFPCGTFFCLKKKWCAVDRCTYCGHVKKD